jgi:hypothetical protein
MLKKIRDIYNFKPLPINKISEQLKSSRVKNNPTIVTYQPKNYGIVGIEIEVEGIPCKMNSQDEYFPLHDPLPVAWQGKEDGSLRNHGVEYVSVPIRNWEVPVALDLLAKHIKLCRSSNFSPRCGTHFHINIRDFTEEDLAYFVMYYMIYEKFFFHLAGKERLNSYHCAPLTQLYIREYLLDVLGLVHMTDPYANADKYSSWHKYTSLNLSSIPKFGTLEVRLLPGGYDWNKLAEFIDIILQLRNYIIKTDKKILRHDVLNLNSYSNYYTLTLKVFNNVFHALPKLHYHSAMRDAVCVSKVLCHILNSAENFTLSTNISQIVNLKGSSVSEESEAFKKFTSKCIDFGCVPKKHAKVTLENSKLGMIDKAKPMTATEYFNYLSDFSVSTVKSPSQLPQTSPHFPPLDDLGPTAPESIED